MTVHLLKPEILNGTGDILIPFVNCCYKQYYRYQYGHELTDDITSVCWCDGGQSQLAAITTEASLQHDVANKIVTCKHAQVEHPVQYSEL